METLYSLDIVKAVSPLETLCLIGSFSNFGLDFVVTFFRSVALSIAEEANSVTLTLFRLGVVGFSFLVCELTLFGKLIS